MTNRKQYMSSEISIQTFKGVNQQKAIEEIESLFQVSDEKLDILMRAIGKEMHNGLNIQETNENQNDLKMIPSFVAGKIMLKYYSHELWTKIIK